MSWLARSRRISRSVGRGRPNRASAGWASQKSPVAALALGLLNSPRMKRLLLLVWVSACAAQGASASGGGGGVSFGGQQDIGEFRGILESGGLPGPDTLDANGFFNEHYNA